MTTLFTQAFGVNSRRLRTVVFTSGAGVYTPTSPGNRHIVTLLGGGQSSPEDGHVAGASGVMRVTELVLYGPVNYSVAAPAPANSSYTTTFGEISATGGSFQDGYYPTYGGRYFQQSWNISYGGNGSNMAQGPMGLNNTIASSTQGGSTLYGTGATETSVATGYGAGGAKSTNPAYQLGTGGLIIVEEYA